MTYDPSANDPNSIVDYLKSHGLPSDLTSRTVLAQQHGIAGYAGTAEQNIRLLAILRNLEANPTFWEVIKGYMRKILG
jgi:hypothetical protein